MEIGNDTRWRGATDTVSWSTISRWEITVALDSSKRIRAAARRNLMGCATAPSTSRR